MKRWRPPKKDSPRDRIASRHEDITTGSLLWCCDLEAFLRERIRQSTERTNGQHERPAPQGPQSGRRRRRRRREEPRPVPVAAEAGPSGDGRRVPELQAQQDGRRHRRRRPGGAGAPPGVCCGGGGEGRGPEGRRTTTPGRANGSTGRRRPRLLAPTRTATTTTRRPAAARSTFAGELDVALDRNASEIFARCHRELWPLARSLPEVLHHARRIVDLLLAYLLSPHDAPGEKSAPDDGGDDEATDGDKRKRYVVNQATTDVLHLLAVLARDLRHEIHPFLHTKILPRILRDMLSPPAEPGTQPQPLDATLVEAAFRAISYIFRYDAGALLAETVGDDGDDEGEPESPCLEPMRRHYGVTLAHRRDVVRRLAAESFAPLLRRLPSDSARRRHGRRVLRALAAQRRPSSRRRAVPRRRRSGCRATPSTASRGCSSRRRGARRVGCTPKAAR